MDTDGVAIGVQQPVELIQPAQRVQGAEHGTGSNTGLALLQATDSAHRHARLISEILQGPAPPAPGFGDVGAQALEGTVEWLRDGLLHGEVTLLLT